MTALSKVSIAPLQSPVMGESGKTSKEWTDWYASIATSYNKIIESLPPTGSIMFGVTAANKTEWLDIDDGTIGSASSGATNLASTKTFDLFIHLWTYYSNTVCPVSTGRGADAKSDFLANKTIGLPKLMGRTVAVSGSGSGLTSRDNGAAVGEETHTSTADDLFRHHHDHYHTHTFTDKDFGATINSSQPFVLTVVDNNAGTTGTDIVVTTTTACTGIANTVDLSSVNTTADGSPIATEDFGNTVPFTQFQPTTFLPAIIKL